VIPRESTPREPGNNEAELERKAMGRVWKALMQEGMQGLSASDVMNRARCNRFLFDRAIAKLGGSVVSDRRIASGRAVTIYRLAETLRPSHTVLPGFESLETLEPVVRTTQMPSPGFNRVRVR
jgi:hypothetical protein